MGDERIRPTRSGLFMIELLIAVGVFTFCAAVCVGLFVRSEVMSRESADLTRMTTEARNIVECWKAVGGDFEKTAERTAEYYAADAEAARIVAALARGAASDAGTVEAMSGTDDLWDDGSSLYEFRVPASGEQELSVSLRLYPDGKYEILSWSTGYVGGWETNDTINIWDGDF